MAHTSAFWSTSRVAGLIIAVSSCAWAADGIPAAGSDHPADPAAKSNPVQPPAPRDHDSDKPNATSPPTIPELAPGPGVPSIPGLDRFLRPEGFVLPGGVGIIRPEPGQIDVEINTPDGPLRFRIPRRHRRRGNDGNVSEPPAPAGDTDAPAFGKQSTANGPGKGNGRMSPRDENAPARQNAILEERRSDAAHKEFASAARLFRARSYSGALRRVNRSLEKVPGDRDLLQLRSLVYFALAEYTAAYRDALAVMAEDETWDWPTLRSLYRSADEYTAQFRALEEHVFASPSALESRFLLGYHYLMLGHGVAARRQFERVVAFDPGHETARRLLTAERAAAPRPERPTASEAIASPSTAIPPDHSTTPKAPRSKPLPSKGSFTIDLGEPGSFDSSDKPGAASPKNNGR